MYLILAIIISFTLGVVFSKYVKDIAAKLYKELLLKLEK